MTLQLRNALKETEKLCPADDFDGRQILRPSMKTLRDG